MAAPEHHLSCQSDYCSVAADVFVPCRPLTMLRRNLESCNNKGESGHGDASSVGAVLPLECCYSKTEFVESCVRNEICMWCVEE